MYLYEKPAWTMDDGHTMRKYNLLGVSPPGSTIPSNPSVENTKTYRRFQFPKGV